MKLFKQALKYLYDEKFRRNVNSILGFNHYISDEEFLKRAFKSSTGYDLNLENPQTFNEKLQWLKLYDRKPEYTRMADKYEAKKYAAEIIGDEYIIPNFGVWDTFDEIDFDKLPQQFVLKCNHDCGSIIIVRDKNKFNKAYARKFLTKCLKRNYFWMGREWPYKNIKPRIIAEQYMEDSTTKDLRDYKFFTFDGVAKAMYIATDRQTKGEETKFDFYDMDFKHLDFRNGHPNAENANFKLAKPEKFEKMRQLAEKLSQKIPQLRVDFYEVNGKVYFGELTFFHWGGMTPFEPEKWDKTFGDWIKLPDAYTSATGGGGGYYLIADGYILYLHQRDTSLTDYKFYCFNGEPKYLYVSKGLENHATARISFLNLDWTFAPFNRSDYKPFTELPPKPENFELMKDLAAKLAENTNFLRVDLYEINGRVYFSECTFFPCGGMMPFIPEEYDKILGGMLKI